MREMWEKSSGIIILYLFDMYFFSLKDFQEYNTLLLITVNMLHSTSLELIPSIKLKFSSLQPISMYLFTCFIYFKSNLIS